jgi:hypothetical protein
VAEVQISGDGDTHAVIVRKRAGEKNRQAIALADELA